MFLKDFESLRYDEVLCLLEDVDPIERLEVVSLFNNDLTVRSRYYFEPMDDVELRKASGYFSIWAEHRFEVVLHVEDKYYYKRNHFFDYLYVKTVEGVYIGLEYWKVAEY